MKKINKKVPVFVFLMLLFSVLVKAQTNVSGGIYTNTTWTLAGSPYIVVDTVVVFPGVTLTIDPGVTVKLANNKRLEIRGTLIAVGNVVDSITFTSNSLTPTPGIHNGVYSLATSSTHVINYCNFFYGTYGILGTGMNLKNSSFKYNLTGVSSTNYNVFIDTCVFSYNTNIGLSVTGLQGITKIVNYCYISDNGTGLNLNGTIPATHDYEVRYCTITSNQTGAQTTGWKYDNCTITSNQTGINSNGNNQVLNSVIDSNSVKGIHVEWPDSVMHCAIRYNGIGIELASSKLITGNIIEYDSIGVKASSSSTAWQVGFYCNKLCNNSAYDFYYVATGNVNIPANYWCTTDSNTITTQIYDGYDDISYGLVNFTPVDSFQCYNTGCNLIVNANVTNATCDTCPNGAATAIVYNGLPPYTYTWFTTPIQNTQTAAGLTSGVYTVCVSDANGCTACNSNVFVDSTNCTGFSVSAQSNNATCATCSDGTATANVSFGTPPYSYTWYTSPVQTTQTATMLPQGTYAVCVADLYGCLACDTVAVGVGNCSAYFVLYPDTAPQTYLAVNMASGVPPLSYSWNWGDASPFDTVPYPSHTYAAPGLYTICLTITDSVGCVDTHCVTYYLLRMTDAMIQVNVVANLPTGTPVSGNENFFSVFPNPASGYLSLILDEYSDANQISIYSVTGIRQLRLITGKPTEEIDISLLSQGIYFIEVVSGNKIGRKRFIKL